MIVRHYTGEDGTSHFEALPLTFDVYAEVRERTPLQAATGIRFLRWPAGYFHDWHNAPRRQYVIVLSGQVEVGNGDGTVGHFGPGDVALEEDLTGPGHTARVVGEEPLLMITVPLAG
jgi:quercetin dioxygenase-like cupin family protein